MTIYSNLRRNPFTGAYSYRTMDTESHTIAELSELPGIYGFQLQDKPKTGSVTVTGAETGGSEYNQVTVDPSTGQCRIDYTSGYIIFNVADNGKEVTVDYEGGGSNTSIDNLRDLAGNDDRLDALELGWLDPDETWTYESASTFSVAADVTTKYSAGDKIKWTQTTVKYGYIVSIGSYTGGKTIITIAVNQDYTIANAPITNNYYSRFTSPIGFPQWFSFTPSWTNITVGAGTNEGFYAIIGRTVFYRARFVFAADSSVGGAISLTLPVAIATYSTAAIVGQVRITDTSPATLYSGFIASSGSLRVHSIGTTYLQDIPSSATVPISWATGDSISIQGFYQF